MKSILKIALGIIAALGGFLDIGDLVFNTQAGALYRYDLLWAVVLGTIGIGVYAEMCGRVAAVTGRPVFDTIRMRLGFGMGLVALIASTFVNVLTVAAELGGLAIVLTLLFDAAFSLFVVLAAIGLVISVALLPFGGIERIFGYCGLLMLVFVATAVHQHPDWGAVAHGFVPSLSGSKLYLYFVVGVFAAALMPYEVHFYSSGAIEEGWTEENLKENRLNAIVGYGLGGVLACALVVVSGYLFHPLGVEPGDLGTVALPAQGAFGETGLLLALGGMMFCVGGAAIDSSFSASYNLAQFLGWEWGRYRGPEKAPRFTVSWLVFLLLAVAIVLTGINPVEITEYSVVFAVVALPLTYLPILLLAGDRSFMGEHANGRISTHAGVGLLRDHRRPGGGRDSAAADDERRWRVSREGEILVVHRLLDEQILDSHGKRCGRVDDIELQGSPPRVTAVLVGEGLYPRRLPKRLRGLARRLAGPERWGSNTLRVPWERVDRIDAALHLCCKAEELGLGEGDDPERWMVRRLPWN